MKKQPFIREKRCSFLLADIGIDFLVLEKKKTKMCFDDSWKSSILKKDEEKQSEKIDFPVHQIQKCKKNKILLECVASTSTANLVSIPYQIS